MKIVFSFILLFSLNVLAEEAEDYSCYESKINSHWETFNESPSWEAIENYEKECEPMLEEEFIDADFVEVTL